MKEEHRLHRGQRVRLKGDGQDQLYEKAAAYSEGWVHDLDFDEVGFPMIAVHWDREHWAYNGEKDIITFEDHFEPVEEPMDPENDPPNIVEWMAAQAGLSEEAVRAMYAKSTGAEPVDEEEESALTLEAAYDSEVEKAFNDAVQAEAFILLVLNAEPYEGSVALTPKLYQGSHSPKSALIAQTFLSTTAAKAHEQVTDMFLEFSESVKPERQGG